MMPDPLTGQVWLSEWASWWNEMMPAVTAKATVILGAALIVIAFRGRFSAAVRHYLLVLAVGSVILLPFLTLMAPPWQVFPVPEWLRTNSTIAPTSPAEKQSLHPRDLSSPETIEGEPEAPPKEVGRRGPRPRSLLIFAAWLIGAGAMTVRTAVGWLYTRWLLRRTRPAAGGRMSRLLAAAAEKTGLTCAVRLLYSDIAPLPFACNWFNPAIVLPAACRRWPGKRVEIVLLHELAHIKRGDTVIAGLADLALCIFWYHPLAWLVRSRIAVEREHACDDLVLSLGTQTTDYARQLLEIGRSLSRLPRYAWSRVAMARTSNLEDRIMNILSRRLNHKSLTAGRMSVIAFCVTAALLPVASLSGRPAEVTLHGVTPAEKDAIVHTLTDFYGALNAGEDYDAVCEQYLAAGYFDRPELTLETMERSTWRKVFDNTLELATKRLIYPQTARSRIISINRDGDRYVVRQISDVFTNCPRSESIEESDGTTVLRPVRDAATGEIIYEKHNFVKALEHEIVFIKDDGRWKIADYDDGISVRRMDTDNPYGPIHLVWIDDLGPQTTPYGPVVSKVFPQRYTDGIPCCNIEFQLEGIADAGR